jgi:hypothetical protein
MGLPAQLGYVRAKLGVSSQWGLLPGTLAGADGPAELGPGELSRGCSEWME